MPDSQPNHNQADEAADAASVKEACIEPDEKKAGIDNTPAASPPRNRPSGEEPEPALEPDLPSDGRDKEGEEMIRDLPQRPELSEPPSQPNQTASKP